MNAAGHPRSNARSHMHLSTVSIHPYIRAHTAYLYAHYRGPGPATTTYVNIISSVLSQAAGCVVVLTVLIVSAQNNPNRPAHLGEALRGETPPTTTTDMFGRSH
jgi:hypothetical protein